MDCLRTCIPFVICFKFKKYIICYFPHLLFIKVGLEAVQEEERKKKDEQNEERKKVLRGPSIHSASKIGSLKRVQELLQYFPEMIS